MILPNLALFTIAVAKKWILAMILPNLAFFITAAAKILDFGNDLAKPSFVYYRGC